MLYFILILIFILFLILNRNKKHNFIFLLFLVFIILLMGGNYKNEDSLIYYNIYYGKDFFSKDILFGVLINFSKYIGLTLLEFRLIIAAFGLVLIYSTVRKYTNNILIFSLLYLSFPFFFDVVQIRNFLGISLVFFAIPYLTEKSKLKKLFSLFLILCATLIQKTHLIWFLIILISKLLKSKKATYIYLFVCFSFSLLFLIPSVSSMLGNLLKSTGLNGIEYFIKRSTRLGWAIKWFMQIINLIIMNYCNKVINKDDNVREKEKKLSENINKYNIAACFCLPLYILNSTYGRIIRNIMIVMYLAFSIFFKTNNAKNNLIYYIIILIIYILLMLFLNIIIDDYVEKLIFNLFRSNWIIF